MINAVSGSPLTPPSTSQMNADLGAVQPASTPIIQPVSSTGPAAAGFKSSPKQKPPMKMILGGLLMLFLVLGAGVGYYLTQQPQDVRQQAAGETPSPTPGSNGVTCSLTFVATGTTSPTPTPSITPGVSPSPSPSVTPIIACTKNSYQDEFSNTAGTYSFLTEKTTFEPGDKIVFKIVLLNNTVGASATISLSDVLTANNLDKVTFLDSNCGANAYNSTSKTLTCPSASVDASGSKVYAFRVQVNSNLTEALTITNTATATSGDQTATCSVPVSITIASVSPSPSPSVTPSVSPSPSPSVTPGVSPSPTVSPSPGTTPDVTPSPGTTPGTTPSPSSTTIAYVTPTPAVGCNQSCVTNADCVSSTQICVQTSSGQKCRLETDVNSETCTTESSTTVAQTGSTPAPSTLPVAGSTDIFKAFLIGAAAVVLGVFGLLLL